MIQHHLNRHLTEAQRKQSDRAASRRSRPGRAAGRSGIPLGIRRLHRMGHPARPARTRRMAPSPSSTSRCRNGDGAFPAVHTRRLRVDRADFNSKGGPEVTQRASGSQSGRNGAAAVSSISSCTSGKTKIPAESVRHLSWRRAVRRPLPHHLRCRMAHQACGDRHDRNRRDTGPDLRWPRPVDEGRQGDARTRWRARPRPHHLAVHQHAADPAAAVREGQSAEIGTAFVEFPALEVINDPQRYTCLEEGKRYLFESRDSDFRRELEVDQDGLVVTYPGLFRMLLIIGDRRTTLYRRAGNPRKRLPRSDALPIGV